MSLAIDNLTQAMRPAGGFPALAESLRRAGVTRNIWTLPACQALFLTKLGPVVMQHPPLVEGTADVPAFDVPALIAALRLDQAGGSTFPEFLSAAWRAGVIRYEVDFAERTVTYYGCHGEQYVESYPLADLP